jgi:hypothetical protein
MIVCVGPSREPHKQTVVIAKYSCQYGCWVYDCPTCRYDVHVDEQRRPLLNELGNRIDLHRLAVTMADLRTR